MYKLKIKAIWFQKEINGTGYFGGVLSSGHPVKLCSYLSYFLGPEDSVHKRMTDAVERGYHIYNNPKTMYFIQSEDDLVREGLSVSGSSLAVPEELKHLIAV